MLVDPPICNPVPKGVPAAKALYVPPIPVFDILMLVAGIVSVPLVRGFAVAEYTKTFTAVLPGCSTQAVVMVDPAAGDVCWLAAVFSVNGMVIVVLVRFTVSDSGRLALMVTVPVLEFNCATAGVVAKASAMVSSARIPRTFIKRLMSISFAFLPEFRTM